MVLNANDAGNGSLRAAIAQANADNSAGVDVIQFNIAPSGVQTITLANASGPLPAITRPTLIDGSSEPGFAGAPLIVLNGSALSSGDGLVIDAGSSTIQSLVIDNFAHGSGIVIGAFGSTNVTANQVVGCYIGVAPDGSTPAPNDVGVLIDTNASANIVGGTTAAARNILSGNSEFGVDIGGGASANVVEGNYIGIDVSGLSAAPNGRIGIIISGGAHDNTIGGIVDGARNVISANIDNEISIDGEGGAGAAKNVVEGNYIGTDSTGMHIPTGANNKPDAGAVVLVSGASDNTIGGTSQGTGNLISGNGSSGVTLDGVGTNSNYLGGNWIGVDATGAAALPNNGAGIVISNGATNNTIGTFFETKLLTGGFANIISGNNGAGVVLTGVGTSDNFVTGNVIGVDLTVTTAVANAGDGVVLSNGATGNTIGDILVSNLIAGNTGAGVHIEGSNTSGNSVVSNFIGTTSAGVGPVIPNGGDGVFIDGAPNNSIGGGPEFDAGNFISGNGGNGITISGATATKNTVQLNFIGTDSTGALKLGNAGAGVAIFSANNLIGSGLHAGANTIAFNGGAGVMVGDATGGFTTGNSISQNSIFGNGDLGINSTPGTLGDFPTLLSALSTDQTLVSGTLSATPNTIYTIQFFTSKVADPSGFGQGQVFSGLISIGTDSTGNASFQALLPTESKGDFISATATAPDGTTSRFSKDVQVVTPGLLTLVLASAIASGSEETLTFAVKRTAGSDGTVTVDYATSNGTAIAGTDYVAASGTLTFGPGETEKTFTVLVLDDGAVPNDLTFQVALANPTGGATTAPQPTVTVTISGNSSLKAPPNVRYVAALYSALLGRTADPGGAAFWTSQIGQGVSRQNVTLGFEYSAEGRIALVQSLYQTYLHRAADPQGLQSSVAFLSVAGPVEQLKAEIIGSQEYFQVRGGGTNSGFLAAIYDDVLGRGIDPASALIFGQALNQGAPRFVVALIILRSPEADQVLVQSLYLAYLGRQADPVGAKTFITALQNGARDEAVIAALLGSEEFFSHV